MKRQVLTYLIICVLAAASCKKMPDLHGGAAIEFAAPSVSETKSVLIDDETDLKIGPNMLGYSVFAARYTADVHEIFMNNLKVYRTTSEWTYGDNVYYWSPGASYKFFAVYPYADESDAYESDAYDLGLSYEINEEQHALQVVGKHVENSVMYICTGMDEQGNNLCPDILYGVTKYSDPYSAGEEREPITFQLNHALSALSLKFRNASENKIKSIVVSGPIKGFKNAAKYVWLSEKGAQWDKNPIEVDDHSFTVPGFTALNANEYISQGGYYTTMDDYWYTALMIPQEFGTGDSPYFTFTVTFDTGETSEYTINFQDYAVHSTAEYAFTYLPGNHYVYNINITAKYVYCDVSIVPWIEDKPINLN